MSVVLVDSHVHLHAGVAPESLLLAAWSNFQRLVAPESVSDFLGILMLTQMAPARARWPNVEWERRGQPAIPGWSSHFVDDVTQLFEIDRRPRLLVMAGQQVVTREGLEVLALATSEPVPSRLELAATVDHVMDVQGIPVLPWGFGKWWGKRGRKLESFLAARPESPVLLGDNGCRPTIWGCPKFLRPEISRGRPVVVGSDPLPLSGHERRVGSVANSFDWEADLNHPTAWIRASLNHLGKSPPILGRFRRTFPFLTDQIRLRGTKR